MKAAALLAVAVSALGVGSAAAGATAPLTVRTSVSPRSIRLADTVTARVTVVVDRRLTDPGALHVTARFGGWDQVAPTRVSSTSSGSITRRTWSFDIACLEATCLAHRTPLAVHLPPVSVSATRHDGSTVTVRRAWPTISIAPRFGNATRGATPAFEVDQTLPPARYRAGPTGVGRGLDVAAALLAAFGLSIVALEILRRRPSRVDEVPPLTRALTFVREAKSRPVDDRRRAVGLLARLLERDRRASLSSAASQIAWAAGTPSPDGLEELAQRVEADSEARA